MSAAVRRRKRKLVQEVLGKNAFDPWERLDEKQKRGLDISVEARYLESQGIKRKKGVAAERERRLEELVAEEKAVQAEPEVRAEEFSTE